MKNLHALGSRDISCIGYPHKVVEEKRCQNCGVSVNWKNEDKKEQEKSKVADGHEMSAQTTIGFDLGIENIPSSKGSYLVPDGTMQLIIPVLDKYYSLFDSGNHEDLFYAYHEQAMLSIHVVKGFSNSSQSSLQFDTPEGWNFLVVHNSKNELKIFKQGRMAIVRALSQLPKVHHIPQSFVIDVSYASEKLMSFSVVGVLKVDDESLRTFHRTFLVVPNGQWFMIMSDIFCITNPSVQQKKLYKSSPPTTLPSPSLSSAGEQISNDKEQSIAELMDVTGMNSNFSAKCLSENGWDFNRACLVFAELNTLGKIPQEAFLK